MAFSIGINNNLRIKRIFGTVHNVVIPPMNISTGTKDANVANEIETMLDELPNMGKHGATILHQLSTKQRKPLEVLYSWKKQEAKDIPALLADELLSDAWERFVDNARKKDDTPVSNRTKHDYKQYIKLLNEIDPEASISALPALLTAYRTHAIAAGHLSQFRKVRASAQAFARHHDTDKQFGNLWKEISKVAPTAIQRGKENAAMRVYECRILIEKLPTQMQHIAWGMALTGMSPKDYAGEWTIKSDRVIIKGTKNINRVREVPLLSDIKPQPFYYVYPGEGKLSNNVKGNNPTSYFDFNERVRIVSKKKASANTFRHCYRLWLREAGVPEYRADKYFGHVTKTLASHYAGHEIEAFLEEDTVKLVAYIQREWEQPKHTRKKIERLSI